MNAPPDFTYTDDIGIKRPLPPGPEFSESGRAFRFQERSQ